MNASRTVLVRAVWAVVTAMGMLIAGEPAIANPLQIQACIGSGTETEINAALAGPDAHAELCPGAVFELHNPVAFTAPNQRLRTQGLPLDGSRATLRIANPNLTLAVVGNDQPGAVVENIQVDGNRGQFGHLASHALILMGGGGNDQTVQNIVARNTRSWSTISFQLGPCLRGRVLNNEVGPAGEENSNGRWADGISIGCGDMLVQGNTIRDATDGGIVIFGAAGSLIQSNRIIAETKELLGGILMVDSADFTGTRVDGNTIDAKGGYVRVAIGQGPRIWGRCAAQPFNSGGAVTNNTLVGMHMGYGVAVAGVANWTVTGNVDHSRHVGVATRGCDNAVLTPPGGFQVQSGYSVNAVLQPEFRSAVLSGAVSMTEPPVLKTPVLPPVGCGRIDAGQGLYPDQSVFSCDGRFQLRMQADGNLVLYQGATAIWATSTNGTAWAGVQLLMQGDGNLRMLNSAGITSFETRTAGNSGAFLGIQTDGNVVLYTSANRALWATNTCCR